MPRAIDSNTRIGFAQTLSLVGTGRMQHVEQGPVADRALPTHATAAYSARISSTGWCRTSSPGARQPVLSFAVICGTVSDAERFHSVGELFGSCTNTAGRLVPSPMGVVGGSGR